MGETIDEYTFPEGEEQRFSRLSYLVHSQKYVALNDIIQAMVEDPGAYVKSICGWLGKNPESDVRYCHEVTADAVYEKAADMVGALPSVVTGTQYKDFVKRLKEVAEGKILFNVNAVNEFLSQNQATAQYCIASRKINGRTYYFVGTGFPFRLSHDITGIDALEESIKESKGMQTKAVFQKLFNEEMPDLIGAESGSAFLSVCIQEQEGFEGVYFRRGKEGLEFYSKGGKQHE